MEPEVAKERIHVGGLGEHVTEADLHKILSSIGATVQSLHIIRTKARSFAYIDFVPNSDKALSKLFSTYNGCVWKGGKLRLERAKEHYLSRLRREWAEVAEIESGVLSKHEDVIKSNASPEKPSKNAPTSEKKQLQIFFPRLRKMKSLPYSGTGKHKYSFQRIQEPSHPVHFCDCEEHAVTFHTEKERQATNVLAQNGGVVEEEFDIMNSVMSKLLKRDSESNVMDADPGLAQEEDRSHESKSDGETDEDNLIMNMVTSSTPTLSEDWEQERNLRNKESNFNKRHAPKDWSAENPRKVQKRDLVTPEKKMQALPTKPVSREFVSALPESKENMQNKAKESAMFLGAQSSKPEFGVQQSTTNHSWSQKNSWKELIGNRDNSTFSVSKILPGIGSAKDNPPQKSSKVQKRDSAVSPKKKRKSVVSKQNNNAEIVSAIPESEGNMLNQSNESEMLLDAQSTEPESSIKQLASGLSVSPSQNSSSKELVDDKDNSTDLKVLPSTDPANKEQERPDHLSMSVSTQNNSQKVQSHQEADDQAGLTQKQAELVDSQPTKQDTGSNKSGRGAAWLQKSSWTELVRESNTTFSISQILPGISFEKQESLETKNVEAANSTGSKHPDLSYQEKTESIMDARKASETGKGSILSAGSSDVAAVDMVPSFNVLGSGPKKKLQKITSNQEAPISVPEKECDSTTKATARADSSVIGETCSFMRSTASLKEWATTKAALSKGKGKEK